MNQSTRWLPGPALAIAILCSFTNVSKADPSYWKQGQAEISRFELQQARYGEIHPGEAVMIFVSEPFSKSKHVKLDDWQGAGSDHVEVLKLNFTRNFLTGVYPYSVMTSVFTPMDPAANNPYPLKTTMSVQEWCGHVFNQLNLRDDHYLFRGFSYFESEGDAEKTLPRHFLEDGIWTTIRIDPNALPVGDVVMIPSMLAARFAHKPLLGRKATASLRRSEGSEHTSVYRVDYTEGEHRSLAIEFEMKHPHAIVAWEERVPDGKGEGGFLVTTGKRTASMLLDYWNKNSGADRPLRTRLGLEF